MKKPNIGHGIASEKKTAKRLSGKLKPGSGAMEGAKGDMSVDGYLIENKSTIKESMTLKLDWLHKISNEALQTNQTPALAIQFVTGNGDAKPFGKWVAIPERDFQEYLRMQEPDE